MAWGGGGHTSVNVSTCTNKGASVRTRTEAQICAKEPSIASQKAPDLMAGREGVVCNHRNLHGNPLCSFMTYFQNLPK